MTAGFFSPLPPARTGVAAYSASLLTELRRLGDVRIGENGDANLYHLGNNQMHRSIYEHALAYPGVVVIHDAVLHHFLLGTLPHDRYVGEFIYNYGPWHADLAERLWQKRAHSGVDPCYFQYPMLRRAVENARAVIVHNGAAKRLAEEHYARRVIEIPHLFVRPEMPADYEVTKLREQMGVGSRTCLFGVFGHLRESKRLPSVIQAFSKLDADAALLVAGEFASSDLERSLEPLLSRRGIVRIGYTTERDSWRYAAAVNVCVNLKYPGAGETSGIGVRLMGIGKPVIVTAGEETAGFPEAACLRVDAGVAEVDMLIEYMTWLAQFPDDARAIGIRAAAHIAEFHDPARIAAQYWRVLRESIA